MKAILHILHKLVYKKCPVIFYKHGCQGPRVDPTLNVNPLVCVHSFGIVCTTLYKSVQHCTSLYNIVQICTTL